MLALPMISAESGFIIASILLITMWALMTITGLLTLEVNLAFEEYANSLGTMATKTLGFFGKFISWVCTLLLLYALTAAYISGGGSLLANLMDLIFHTKIPAWINSLIFLLVMGGIIFWSTKSVDYCNRFFMSLKGVSLITVFVLLLPQINLANTIKESHNSLCLWTMLPIFLCSFGFHPTIPSLTNYIGRKPKEIKFAIICGASVALVIYLLWLFIIMSVIPWNGEHSFTTIKQSGNSVGDLIKTVYLMVNNKWVTAGINTFSSVAITTSFLGVVLGLFDFLADGLKRPNTHFGRLQTSLLTFIPPSIFALFYPQGFILALNYAAFFATILVVILPALMAYSLRKSKTLFSPYRVFGGNPLLVLIVAIGLTMLIIQILISFHLI